jgi:hypothetical protein
MIYIINDTIIYWCSVCFIFTGFLRSVQYNGCASCVVSLLITCCVIIVRSLHATHTCKRTHVSHVDVCWGTSSCFGVMLLSCCMLCCCNNE